MRIVCLSDTHNLLDRVAVPDGDLLVHAGDFTGRGTRSEVEAFARHLDALPHRHKVVVAGNHDFLFEREPAAARALLGDCIYLEDGGCEVGGVRLWGSPWQPWFHDWAFNLERDVIGEKWELIPDDVDLLITHGPPADVLDRTASGEAVGCAALAEAVARVRPRLHVFGHIHEGYGCMERDGVVYANASTCTLEYQPRNAPLVFEWSDSNLEPV